MAVRSRARPFLAALVVVATGAASVGAEDPPPRAPAAPAVPAPPSTPGAAADAVIAAFTAKDDARLRALAAADAPDPWLVADELGRRGAWDAALAYAGAAPRKAVSRLADCLAAARAAPPDPRVVASLELVVAALAASDWDRAIAATDGEPPSLDSVPALRLAFGRGLALVRRSRWDEAVRALVGVADASRRLGWFSRTVAALQEIGACAYARARWDEAVTAWEAARALAVEIGDRSRAAQAIGNLGLVHYAHGDFAKAMAAYERALAEHLALGDAVNAGKMRLNIGNVHKVRGEFPEAVAALERAIEELERAGERVVAEATRSSLGGVYRSLGDPARALAMQERALAAQLALRDRTGAARTRVNIGASRFSLGEDAAALAALEQGRLELEALGLRGDAAAALGSIATLHLQFGRYAKGIASGEQALDALRRVGDRVGVAGVLASLALAHSRLGDLAKAIALLEGALAEQQALGERAAAATTLGNLGALHYERGDDELALATDEQALAANRALGRRGAAAQVLSNMSLVEARLGRPERALALHEEALEALLAAGERVAAARTLANAGRIHRGRHDLPRAIAAYERALGLLDAAPSAEARVFVLWGLAVVRLDEGAYAAVATLAREAIELTSGLAHGLAEGEGAGARDIFAELFELGTRAALELGDTASLAWFLEQGRSGSLREALGSRGGLESAVVPDALLEDLHRARAAQTRALDGLRRVASNGSLSAADAASVAWEDAKRRVEETVARIEREAKAAASVTMGVTDDEATLRASVRADEALVLYGFAGGTAVALVVREGGSRAVRLPGRAKIEAAAAALLADDERHVVPEAAAALRALVVEPLALGPEVKRVLISPTGILGYVPFALLWPDRDVASVPSGTTYGLLLAQRARRGEGVLALGDPEYGVGPASDAAARPRGGAFRRLQPLPATRREVESIGGTALLGSAASEAGFARAVATQARWRAVHFACHGLVDPERPMFSSLALSADAENDGFLSAIEIFRSKIPADLVVLSACESGKGRIFLTEGIVGLTRAFMFAGAPRVICSLWNVDDDATRALMTKFYELWNPKDGSRGLAAVEALRGAQAHVRSQPAWAHPSYWAAWVLWGLPE